MSTSLAAATRSRPPSLHLTRLAKANPGGAAAFLAVFFMTQVDVNQIAAMMLGINEMFSIVLLITCLACYIFFQFRFGKALGQAGVVLVGFLLFFYSLSVAVLLTGLSDRVLFEAAYVFRSNVTSLIIILAAALGSHYLFVRHGTRRALWIIAVVCLIQISLMCVGAAVSDTLFTAAAYESKMARIGGRSTGIFGDPNQAGFAVAAGSAVLFGCLIAGRHTWLIIAGLLGAAAFVMMTFSRSSIVTFALLLMVQFSISPILKRKSLLLAVPLILAGIVWMVSGGFEKLGDVTADQEARMNSFSEMLHGNFAKETTGSRFLVAANGIRYWLESPLFGHGLGKGQFIEGHLAEGGMPGPHNTFILLLIEGGAPALLAFLLFLLVTLKESLKCKEIELRVFALGYLAVFLCGCMTLHTMLSDNNQAAMLGVLVGALAASKQRRKIASAVMKRSPQLAPVSHAGI